MRLVLDAGALIGIERADRRVAGLIALAARADAGLLTVAPALAQVWRDGARQAHLARALPMIEVVATDTHDAKLAGELLGLAGSADVVDALVALAARPGDQVLTSDPQDLTALLRARGVEARVVVV